MNVITLTGNAVKDIDLRYSQSGTAIGKGTIAVQRDFKNKQTNEYETDFINFTTFGKQAEIMANHIQKGDKFGITGRLQIDQYDKDGQRQYFTNVVVNSFDFPNKSKTQNTGGQGKSNTNTPNYNQNANTGQYGANNGTFGQGQPMDINPNELPF